MTSSKVKMGAGTGQETGTRRYSPWHRGHTYALFGRLYREGLTAATLREARAIPELAETLPETFEADEAAADHHHLFGFNVFPFQSFFLDPSGLLGGEVTKSVRKSYQEAGFAFEEGSEDSDHISHELAFLAYLSLAEAEAWEKNRPAEATRLGRLQRDFLDRHLLPWLPPLLFAIRQQRQPFFYALADLTLALVKSHRAEGEVDVGFEFSLPPVPSLLSDDRTGLRDIVAYFLTPPYSGVYLSRDDVGRLAQQQNLPRGFGERRQMLVNLFHSAAHYDGLEPLMAALAAVLAAWRASYRELDQVENVRPFAKIWGERVETTQRLLAEVERRIQSLAIGE